MIHEKYLVVERKKKEPKTGIKNFYSLKKATLL